MAALYHAYIKLQNVMRTLRYALASGGNPEYDDVSLDRFCSSYTKTTYCEIHMRSTHLTTR